MNFCPLASPPKRSGGGRKRWVGLFKIRLRILFKESSNFVQKVIIGGEDRIRTCIRLGRTAFREQRFNHSATSPFLIPLHLMFYQHYNTKNSQAKSQYNSQNNQELENNKMNKFYPAKNQSPSKRNIS